MDSAPLIVVLGTCSGGTSCIAGILHHLGVNMGAVTDRPSRTRGYPQYEDQKMGCFKHDRGAGPRPGGSWGVNEYRFDWLGYQRFRTQNRDGRPIGVKCSGGDILNARREPEVKQGVRIVRVRRSLDTVVPKEVTRWSSTQLVSLEGDDLDYEAVERAGYAAKAWMATELVCREIPPVYEVLYESVLHTTRHVVEEMSRTLGLGATAEQIDAAVASVRR